MESYRVLALQMTCHAVNLAADRQEARDLMQKSINRLAQQIPVSLAFIGFDCRLIVLPEYFLTGFPMGESFEVWQDKACLEMNGAEYESLGKIAQNLVETRHVATCTALTQNLLYYREQKTLKRL
ncbi:hypothetical protein RIVM261_089860 [Rivularia sp. IAM M-261]|nr:hypothetical protein CAL7716_071410 [Calothrix sp. PCC 7716]GJD24030.1 hypothetical protein RIVM261_089860 [Rivularia sp. IAM M-261]